MNTSMTTQEQLIARTIRGVGVSQILRMAAMALCALASVPAGATSSEAHGYVSISGFDAVYHDTYGGAEGAAAAADMGLYGNAVVTHGDAYARDGALHVSSYSDARVRTSAQGRASASWSDGFAITSSSIAPGQRGTFDVSVVVQGTLYGEAKAAIGSCGCWAISDSIATGNFWINTRVDGGNLASQGGGRFIVDSDGNTSNSGAQSFALTFSDVPFIVGREIAVTLSLATITGTTTFNLSSALAQANYSHTMIWGGLSNVRNADGVLINDYTAVSPESGFDFARAAVSSVPEPASWAFLLTGLALLALARPTTRSLGKLRSQDLKCAAQG
jgi:hypothetical protein